MLTVDICKTSGRWTMWVACLIPSFFSLSQAHLQRNTVISQVQCHFFPIFHYLQPKLLEAPLFCTVLRQQCSFSDRVLTSNLYKDLESWVELMHKNIIASLCITSLGSVLSFSSFQSVVCQKRLLCFSCF